MTIQEQIESFYRFATEQAVNEEADMTIDEIFGIWRMANPTPEEFAENVAAIQASIDNMKNGEKGRDASEVIEEIRKRLNLPSSD